MTHGSRQCCKFPTSYQDERNSLQTLKFNQMFYVKYTVERNDYYYAEFCFIKYEMNL